MSKTPENFAPEVRESAVRMVFDHERDHPVRWAAVVSIAERSLRSADASRMGRPSRIGRPCASTTTWILVVSPPRNRPRQ